MRDKTEIEVDPFVAIRTPDQMIADAARYRQSMLDIELQTSSYFVKSDDGGWKVIYEEESGLEENNARDDHIVALLRLAEATVSLNKNPIDSSYKPISLEDFFKRFTNDKETFGGLHTQMSCDPLLSSIVLAKLEEIFEIPVPERVYSGINSEFSRRDQEANTEINTPNLNEENEDIPTEIHRWRRHKKYTAGALVVVLAACAGAGVIDFNGDKNEETLLTTEDNSRPETATETTTSTLVLNNFECTVNDSGQIIVESGQNLSQIAKVCGKSISELMESNALTDPNVIYEGQILTIVPPVTTTTVPPAETVPPDTTTLSETIPAVTMPPETIPLETAPIETTPAVTMPPETVPLAPINDGFLSQEDCEELGGISHRFEPGETLIQHLKTLGLTSEQANIVSNTEELMTEFKLKNVMASTEGLTGAECVPMWKAIKHIFEINT